MTKYTKLEKAIFDKGYNITSFCREIGISRYTLMHYKQGRNKSLRGTTIDLIAKGLGKSFEDVEKLARS